jgi:hypothetical protein
MVDTRTKRQKQQISQYGLPRDIQLPWLNVTRRLQSASRVSDGLALISITVLVDENGTPRLWLEPEVRLIEPKRSAEEIMKMLSTKSIKKI